MIYFLAAMAFIGAFALLWAAHESFVRTEAWLHERSRIRIRDIDARRFCMTADLKGVKDWRTEESK